MGPPRPGGLPGDLLSDVRLERAPVPHGAGHAAVLPHRPCQRRARLRAAAGPDREGGVRGPGVHAVRDLRRPGARTRGAARRGPRPRERVRAPRGVTARGRGARRRFRRTASRASAGLRRRRARRRRSSGWPRRSKRRVRRSEPTARNKIRKAENEGVRVRRAVAESDFLEYGRMLAVCSRRWGAPLRLRPGLLPRARAPRPGRRRQMWLAEHEGRIIAGRPQLHTPRHDRALGQRVAREREAAGSRTISFTRRRSRRRTARRPRAHEPRRERGHRGRRRVQGVVRNGARALQKVHHGEAVVPRGEERSSAVDGGGAREPGSETHTRSCHRRPRALHRVARGPDALPEPALSRGHAQHRRGAGERLLRVLPGRQVRPRGPRHLPAAHGGPGPRRALRVLLPLSALRRVHDRRGAERASAVAGLLAVGRPRGGEPSRVCGRHEAPHARPDALRLPRGHVAHVLALLHGAVHGPAHVRHGGPRVRHGDRAPAGQTARVRLDLDSERPPQAPHVPLRARLRQAEAVPGAARGRRARGGDHRALLSHALGGRRARSRTTTSISRSTRTPATSGFSRS